MNVARYVTSLVVITSLVVACGGGGGGTEGGGGGASSDSFVSQYCDLYAPCCPKVNKTYDQAKCKLVFAAFLGDSTYDPGAGQTCLDAARAEANGPAFCDTGLSDDADKKCNNVFKKNAPNGTKKPGETCEDDSECSSTAEGEGNCASSFAKDQTIRACQIQTRGKEGEACAGEKDTDNSSTTVISSGSSDGPPPQKIALCFIADGLFCETTFSGSTSTQKCAKTQPIGGTCQSSSEHACVKEAFCDTTAKKCVERKKAGESCVQFASNQCVDKHYCDSTSKTCKPSIADGQPCTKNEECDGRSCTNGKCGFGSSSTGTASFICK